MYQQQNGRPEKEPHEDFDAQVVAEGDALDLGSVDTFGCDCEMCAAGFDCGSISDRGAAKKAGIVPERHLQSAEECESNVAAFTAENGRALRAGEREARNTHRLDYNEQTGALLGSGRRQGGPWSRPQVVAVSRVHSHRSSITVPRRPAGREAHPGQRGRRARRHAATTLRDDGDGADGESDPDADPWPWLACARLSAAEAQRAADRIAAACGGVLTHLGLRQDVEVVLPQLRGDELTAAVIAVYRRLPERLREQHDRAAHGGTEGGGR